MLTAHHAAVLGPLDYLSSLELFGIKLGLDNIRAIVEALGHPERSFKTVHVAGTNGKGSVTAIVDRALGSAGYRSARYTSPHLVDLAERFVIDGQVVDHDRLAEAVGRFRETCAQLLARGELAATPTFFEATTAVALDLFREAGIDVAVCEVGLGGRLDATNVIEPAVTAITTIGFDHERHLGMTIREIAREKAGIIKPGIPVVVGDVPEDARDVIEEVARSRGARIVRASEGVEAIHLSGAAEPGTAAFDGQRIRLTTPVRAYGDIPLALAGAHQIANAVVAVRVLETLDEAGVPVGQDAIVEGLGRVAWPGRLDRRRLADGRQMLLDAAHNPDGARALAAFLRDEPGGTRPIVFAASRDKDIPGMLRALGPVTKAFVMTRASNTRGADPGDLAACAAEVAPGVPALIEPVPASALQAAWGLAPSIVVAGSIFLIGDILAGIRPS